MLHCADSVLVPYIRKIKEEQELPQGRKAFAIFDVFAAHRSSKFLDKLSENNILQVSVPGNCSSELQPLDVSGNLYIKTEIEKSVQ